MSRYYEWLKKGSQRIPHFTRHKDQRLMLFAGMYDSVILEGEYHTKEVYVCIYAYTAAATAGRAIMSDFSDGGNGRRSIRTTLDFHDCHDGGK
jgi:putative SOS response-associated peptidase YedK